MNTSDVDQLLADYARRWVRYQPDPPPIPDRSVIAAPRRFHRVLVLAACAAILIVAVTVAAVSSRVDPRRHSTAGGQRISAGTRARLMSILQTQAASFQEQQPRNLRYVLTTQARAAEAGRLDPSHIDSSAVYVLVADGSFVVSHLGRPLVVGSVLWLSVDAKTFLLDHIGVTTFVPNQRVIGRLLPLT